MVAPTRALGAVAGLNLARIFKARDLGWAPRRAWRRRCADPGIGSPTLGKLLGIPGLRTWRVAKFPLLWCYFERGDHLDMVRLLGERQDIAAILGDEFASD